MTALDYEQPLGHVSVEYVFEVSAISGHKEVRMLQRYTHLRAADLVARLG